MSTESGSGDLDPQDAPSDEVSELRRRSEEAVRTGQHRGETESAVLETDRLIHELKIHQVELEMQNAELQRSRTEVELASNLAKEVAARFTDLYDFAPVGYVSLDRAGVIVESNLAAASMLGTERSRLRDRKLGVFVAEDDRPEFNSVLAGVFESHTTLGCDVALQNHGQPAKFVELTATVSADGQSARVVLIDHTERARAQAERGILENQLRTAQKLEAIGTLVGGIAHDLNNVLAAIYGYTDLAREATAQIPSAVVALDGLSVASQRAATLVRQIMILGRPDLGRRETTNLGDIADEVLNMVRSTASPQIMFELTNTATSSALWADPAQIHEVVMNLVVNAVHAIGAASGRISLVLDDVTIDDNDPVVLEPGTYLRLSVTDSGLGMSPTTLERIFEPFYTTKPQGQGTGLGLWVVDRIIVGHGGRITIDSQPGRGSTFTAFLPTTGTAPLPSPPSAVTAALGNGQLILLVDDEPALCITGTAALRRLGYTVDAHIQPTNAIAAVQAVPNAYAVAVVDLTMPELSGIELAEKLHQIAPSLPIILISGNPGDLALGDLEGIGIQQILTKPTTVSVLADGVHFALQRARR